MSRSPSAKPKLLLVDDDTALGETFRDIFIGHEYEVSLVEDGDEGLDLIEEEDFDAVVTDFEMPTIGGMELLERAHRMKPRLPVIIMTAFSSTDRAIEAMKLGAFDYLIKPVEVPDLLATVEKAVASSRLSARPIEMGKDVEPDKDTIIGSSKEMLKVFKEVGRLAAKPIPILIRGETGSGKEMVARAIFQHGDRSGKPFVAVNCAAIPETLIESELFGHEKGAFTNAIAQRIGRFEQASGGTLFLDEIGDLPWETQVKLLRVLQEQQISRVGGRAAIPIDVRVISATHRDLEAMLAERKFREDLFYRLNGATIFVPPLRERPSDIPALVTYFLSCSAREFDESAPSIHAKAMTLLESAAWPGNVRQLENVVRKALLDSRGLTIGEPVIREALAAVESSAIRLAAPAAGALEGFAAKIQERLSAASRDELEGRGAFETLVEDVERELYAQAVKLSHGNQSHIAKWLGVSRLTVREKLDKFELFPKRKVAKEKRAK
ncbi:MAG: DNA-binding NtrC family response regulator [Verrucomicrobiales bacterium]|jgi:DNA-binding NtrC family response regulator